MSGSIYDIVIIGGGASGLMLASQYDLNGAPGLLLEGSPSLGSKLLMSGGGHCNITHGGPIKEFIKAYGDKGSRLRKCLYKHSNVELASWLVSHGVDLADENGDSVDPSYGSGSMESAGRIFPASMRSKDVLDALIGEASWNGWQIETETKVCGFRRGTLKEKVGGGSAKALAAVDEELWEITLLNGFEIRAKTVVVASGGITYPETGSDGSMLELLEDLGLDVTEPRPALAPIYVEDYPYGELSGISLQDVTVVAFGSGDASASTVGSGGKSAKMKGDLLFTHEGLSGPVILNISKYAEPGELIRLCYNKEMHELPRRMQAILRGRSRGPLGDVRTTVLSSLLNQDDFTIDRVDERGMVTAGGVSLDEIDTQTMRSRKHDSLYVIGEALDIDGITGGYNLQMCWSTACAAADDIRLKPEG